MDYLEYKGYKGSVEYSKEDNAWFETPFAFCFQRGHFGDHAFFLPHAYPMKTTFNPLQPYRKAPAISAKES